MKWARDEHLRAGKRFDVQTEFVRRADQRPAPRVRHGHQRDLRHRVAHARVFLGGDGVNESNPLETGETSALGRALGMWGFGCYGTGIASAEEVLRVADRPDGSGPAAGRGPRLARARTARATPRPRPGAATPARDRIGGGAGAARPRAGPPPGEVALRRAQAGSDEEAVAALRTRARRAAPERRHDARGAVTHAERLGVDAAAYRAYLVARYELTDPEAPESALGDEQLREERERFVRRYQEPDTAAGFREQCARVLRSATA